jgi:integrase
MKLTAKTLDALRLPEGKSDHTYWDEEIAGLGLRIRASGKRSFVYYYRVGTAQRRMSLGPASAQTVTAARTNALKLQSQRFLGDDPAEKKEVAKHEASNTFGATVDSFLAQFTGREPRYTAEVTRHLTEYAKPLHKLPLTKVTQRDIANLLNQMDKRGKATANRVRGSLYGFFTWVLSEGVVLPAGNPVANTRVREEQSRDRVLTDDEIRAVWNACDPSDDFGAIVRLLLLTGQRREEIAALRYDEINGDQIEYPKARTKNGVPHFVPLSDAAKAIIDRFPRDGREYAPNLWRAKRDGREYLFGSDDRGFRGSPNAKTRLDKVCGVKDWTLHDLRRTVATRLGDLGVAPHVIEAILNHVSGHKAGVAGIYNRATYPKERREALNLWAEHLAALVEGRKAVVVPMKRA